MKIRKLLALAVVCVLLFAVSASALATDSPKPTGIASSNPYFTDDYTIASAQLRAADLMNTPRLSISSPSAGNISITASVTAKKVVDKLGFTVLSIEKWNGSAWVSVASWSGRYEYDTTSFSWSGSATGCQSGANYRVSCTFYAKLGTQEQTISATTSYITCR